ncbi:ribosome biogenesis factor YjgA [Gynuella sp.]|uniref:ribosome biogenesis factor YjgA n=1 Tax=Gynuella sp. TaxID=2969146 RepID=UPI003D10C08A
MNKENDWQDSSEDDIEWVSKTRMKKEMHELQEIGMKLMELNQSQLDTIPLTDELIAAITESKRITSREARRRHSQFVGRLMRKADYDAIVHGIELLDPASDAYARLHQQSERWRDRLLTGDNDELVAWFDQYPDCDRQQLRNLLRNSLKEIEQKPDSWLARKKLYQFIKAEVQQI